MMSQSPSTQLAPNAPERSARDAEVVRGYAAVLRNSYYDDGNTGAA
jgi:hypothetical protein